MHLNLLHSFFEHYDNNIIVNQSENLMIFSRFIFLLFFCVVVIVNIAASNIFSIRFELIFINNRIPYNGTSNINVWKKWKEKKIKIYKKITMKLNWIEWKLWNAQITSMLSIINKQNAISIIMSTFPWL